MPEARAHLVPLHALVDIQQRGSQGGLWRMLCSSCEFVEQPAVFQKVFITAVVHPQSSFPVVVRDADFGRRIALGSKREQRRP